MKTRVLVVEDEIIVADSICQYLEDKGYDTCEPAISYAEAVKRIKDYKPEVIILDINLKGKYTGIDLARELKENSDTPFIFLTSNSEGNLFSDALANNPSCFLTKPFNNHQIFAAIELALLKKRNSDSESSSVESNIYLYDGKEYVKTHFNDILFLKSDNVYVEVYLKDGNRIITRSTLNKMINTLNSDFLQVHRSYIVNTNNVDKVGKNIVTISSYEIPIGEKFKSAMNLNFKTFANTSK